MKRVYAIFAAVLLTSGLFAQSPQKMSYQAVIRDATDHLVSTQIGMKISILQGTVDGSVVYTETQTPIPNINGLVTIEIGDADPVSFAAIDWSNGPYFLKTETDPAGETSYTITGTSQLLSVPYALYANSINLSKNNKPYDFYIDDGLNLRILPKISVEKPYSVVPTVTDADANTYGTVKIGTQVWMAENLKTTQYNNNTPIPLIEDNDEWLALSTPAYCWYNNEEATYKTIYGALYNWYALDATTNGGKNVCPTDWHVPTETEWAILTTYLGSFAGGRLKESGTTHWESPNIDAIDDSKFTALPGGVRWNGSFYSIGITGFWWSSTDNIYVMLSNSDGNASIVYDQKQHGFSVRCLKD